MTTGNTSINRHFCIFDYYLDGVFLKWEEVRGECPVLAYGEQITIELNDGNKINAKVVDSEFVSENERHVYLSSC